MSYLESALRDRRLNNASLALEELTENVPRIGLLGRLDERPQ